jgi:hypothetical protein
MKQLNVVLVVFALVIVVALFVYRRRVSTTETYVLPDFDTGGVCPEGYVLACVSNELFGMEDVIPFPSSLPPPCNDPSFPSKPICTPAQSQLRPPSEEYRLKSQQVL